MRQTRTSDKAGELSALRVHLFGDARLEGEGGEVPLSPLQLSLVALVYGHGPRGLSRLSAARLLWGTQSNGRCRQRIRQLLLDIRTRVGQPVFDAHADMLRPLSRVACDLPAFESAVRDGCIEDAAGFVRRGFLATAFTPAKPFEDWRAARAMRLFREVRTAAFTSWSVALERGDWVQARDAAEALYALDREDPQAVDRVIEARARHGHLGAAEAAFAEYVESLGTEGDPARAVVQTMDRVRTIARIGAVRGDSERPKVPFVGRGEVLDLARASLDAVQRGRFELVLLSGESGIGKSSVLDEIHREAVLSDFRCLSARPVELERSIPLNPLLDALSGIDLEPHLEAIGPPWNSVIASLLPHGALDHPPEEPPPIQPSSLSRRLLDSFALLFEHLAREQPTILFLDDLQWADATTVATLQFMQRRWTRGPLGIFATLRPELVRPDDAVAKYLGATAGFTVRRIDLTALTASEALALVDAIGEGRVTNDRATRLCSIAGHHPLYLTELTRDFLAGSLSLPERPADQMKIPSSLAQMLDGRLRVMDDRAMRVAGVLAVAAKPLRVGDVAALAGIGIEDAAGAVETLVGARFIEIEHTRVRIAHELFRSAVYRRLSEPRRAIHHSAIARYLLETSGDELTGEVAIHFSKAGEARLAAEYGWTAARRALDAGALTEAAQFFEVVAESEVDPIRRADATAELAKALHLSRDITRANPQLLLAAQRLRATHRPDLARRLEIRRVEGLAEVDAASLSDLLGELVLTKAEARDAQDWETVALALDAELKLLHRRGDVEGIRVLLGEMRALASDAPIEARALACAGLALGVFFDDPIEALQAARKAVELTEPVGAYRLRALSRLIVVLQARGMLTLPEAAPVIEEARGLARRSGDLLQRFSVESNVAVAFLDAGDVERAEARMAVANELARDGEMAMHRFIQANNEAELSLAQFDFGGASQAFSRASTYLSHSTPEYMQDLVNAGLGYCALETGDLGEARRREAVLRPPPSTWYFDPTTIVAFRARMLERKGRTHDALNLVSEAAADLEGRLVLAWMKVVLLRVRLLSKDSRDEARTLAEDIGKQATAHRLVHRAREFEELSGRLTKPAV